MKAYSNDLRQKVIEAYQRGEGSMRQLADRFSVSLNFVWLLIDRHRRTGSLDPKPHGGGQRRKLDVVQEQQLLDLVRQYPVATLEELAQKFEQTPGGVRISPSTVGLTLRRHGVTRKKVSYHASERDEKEEVEQAREQFRQQQAQLPTKHLIFIDEMGVNLGLARRYGRALCGERVVAGKPVNPGTNISVIGAVGIDGVKAILEVKGSVNGEIFIAFLEQCLGPQLKPGDQVWLDNLSAHKVEGVAEAIEAHQATLHYLPAYSPELSPIELFWSKLKDWLRGAAARSYDELQEALQNGIANVCERDFKRWFKHCGFCIELT